MAYVMEMDWDEKEDQIGNWVSNTGSGIMRSEFGDVPDDCFAYVMEEAARFRIPWPHDIAEVAVSGASAAFYYADVIDPYSLLWDMSDVSMTREWSEFAYEIFDPEGGPISHEPRPQDLETFRYIPGQAELFMDTYRAKPGLAALPYSVGDCIDDLLNGEYNGEEMWDSITADTEKALRALCRLPSGERDLVMIKAYFQFAAWAGFIWLAGPLGRQFRHDRHFIMEIALDYGECILWDGMAIEPRYYRRLERAPMTCYKCGTRAFCVEPTVQSGRTSVICEACLSFGMPSYAGATCGTKFCTLVQCANNPYHSYGDAGQFAAARDRGQLLAAARGRSVTRTLGQPGAAKALPF